MGRILVFTPQHGYYETLTEEVLRRIDEYVPAPFDHIITDDFSNPEDAEKLMEKAGPIVRDGKEIGVRRVKKMSSLKGITKGPNVGSQFQHAFRCAQGMGDWPKDYEAILVVMYKGLIHPGVVEAFREAQKAWGPKAGLIGGVISRYDPGTMTPEVEAAFQKLGLIKEPGKRTGLKTVYSVGGVREDYGIGGETAILGVHIEQKLGAWRKDWPKGHPRMGTLPWMHFTNMYIPRPTFKRKDIVPDASFTMYYFDHDLSHQVKDRGLDIVATDKAVCECGGSGLTTNKKFGKKYQHSGAKHEAQVDGLAHLKAKWHL